MDCADTSDDMEEFAKFFYDLIDSHRDELLFYLDEDAIMDWFGRTIVGSKAISQYLKYEAKGTKHHLDCVAATGPIQHRHKMYDGNIAAESDGVQAHKQLNGNCQAFQRGDGLNLTEHLSEGMDYLTLEDTETPESGIPEVVPDAPVRPNGTQRRVRFMEQPSGDSLAVLPTVRFPGSTVHFLEAQGNIDLFKVACNAKSVKRSSDHRACTMKLGFTKNPSETGSDTRVFIIIYEGNRTCKRNLVSTFEDMQVD